MQTVNPGISFSFQYPTSDETTGLFVRAKIYDITSGSPVFLTNVNMTNIELGYYFGNHSTASAKSYLVIVAVFTDGTYATVDTNFSPWAEIYKSADAPDTFAAFNYGAVGQSSTLNIAADVYDVTTGSEVFHAQLVMTHVFAGVYYAHFTGTSQHVYQVIKVVYTSSMLTTPNTDYGTGSDSFQLFQSSTPVVISNVFKSATLVGQSYEAILVGEC